MPFCNPQKRMMTFLLRSQMEIVMKAIGISTKALQLDDNASMKAIMKTPLLGPSVEEPIKLKGEGVAVTQELMQQGEGEVVERAETQDMERVIFVGVPIEIFWMINGSAISFFYYRWIHHRSNVGECVLKIVEANCN